LQHTPSGGRVNVEVEGDSGIVRLEVVDFGSAASSSTGWPGDDEHHAPELDRANGRGLWIVRHVADDVSVRHEPSGTAVEARFRFADARPDG
jgi:anti-sigma regulatory factor (Ser/Thr protein kinase)